MILVIPIEVMSWSAVVNDLPFSQSMKFTATINDCTNNANKSNTPIMATENQNCIVEGKAHCPAVELAIFSATVTDKCRNIAFSAK